MCNDILSIRLKTVLKGWIYAVPLLRNLFIFLYKINKCRIWGIGYSIYKFTYIKNVVEKQLHDFHDGALPAGYGTGLDERVVEYPWVFSQLKREEKIILDAGSSLNHWDILSLPYLQDRTIYVITLFYEGQYKHKKNVIYRYEDLRRLSFPDEYFDAVLCISTLEHIGMDNTFLYAPDQSKQENKKHAFLEAVKEFRRVLKKGGTLYLTIPYGTYKDHKWFQVFDEGMVRKVKEEFSPEQVSETYFKYENRQWNYSQRDSCKDGYYFDIHKESKLSEDHLAASQSVVCLEFKK